MLKHQIDMIGLEEVHVKYLHALCSASVAGMSGDLLGAINASMASEDFLTRMTSDERTKLAVILNSAFMACDCNDPNCKVHSKANRDA